MEAIKQVAARNDYLTDASCVHDRATNGASSRTKCESGVATTPRPDESVTRPELTGAAFHAALTERRVEPELLGLVRAQAPIRRVLAVLAGRFVYLQGWEPLGFARLGDYGTERLGLSARTLYDLAHTDGVLADLPEIDRAFVCGELSWTKVRLLARVARPGDEEHWLALARGMTSAVLARQVRAVDVGAVERGGVGRENGDDGEEAWENVRIRCTSQVQGKWYRARQLAWRMVGRPVKPWECGEMIAAEVLSTIEMDREEAEAGEGMAEGTVLEEEEAPVGSGNGAAASAIPAGACEAVPSTLPPTPILPASSDGCRPGPKPVATKQEVLGERPLTAPDGPMPPANSGNGRPAPEAVTKDRGEAAPMPSTCMAGPELPACLQSLLDNLREADAFELDARLCRAVAFEQRLDAEIGAMLAIVAHEQLYRYHGSQDTYLFFHAPKSVARLFIAVLCTVRRRIEAQTGRSPTEGEAFEAMLDHVIDVWGGYGRRLPAAHRVFERDGWRCTVPGCSSLMNLHDHHIVFRSAGGSDDLVNRTTLCAWHHLRGVHGGVVRCVGKAPSDLRFELGVRPGTRPLLGFGPGERRVATPA